MILSHAGDIRQKNADDNNIKIRIKKKTKKKGNLLQISSQNTFIGIVIFVFLNLLFPIIFLFNIVFV